MKQRTYFRLGCRLSIVEAFTFSKFKNFEEFVLACLILHLLQTFVSLFDKKKTELKSEFQLGLCKTMEAAGTEKLNVFASIRSTVFRG